MAAGERWFRRGCDRRGSGSSPSPSGVGLPAPRRARAVCSAAHLTGRNTGRSLVMKGSPVRFRASALPGMFAFPLWMAVGGSDGGADEGSDAVRDGHRYGAPDDDAGCRS